jgi:hypothetical protein
LGLFRGGWKRLIGIVDRQYGHALVVGATGAASFFLMTVFMLFTIMNIAKTTMRKRMTAFTNIP